MNELVLLIANSIVSRAIEVYCRTLDLEIGVTGYKTQDLEMGSLPRGKAFTVLDGKMIFNRTYLKDNLNYNPYIKALIFEPQLPEDLDFYINLRFEGIKIPILSLKLQQPDREKLKLLPFNLELKELEAFIHKPPAPSDQYYPSSLDFCWYMLRKQHDVKNLFYQIFPLESLRWPDQQLDEHFEQYIQALQAYQFPSLHWLHKFMDLFDSKENGMKSNPDHSGLFSELA
jgi:hypothetical protein